MNKLLITGSSGFIGFYASDYFREKGVTVIGYDRSKGYDITDLGQLKSVVDKEKPDAILHLAGQVALTTSIKEPVDDFTTNALGTVNVLEAARERKIPVLYASSNKVYLPTSPYGLSKLTGDNYCQLYHELYNVPTIVFRQSCIYGEAQLVSEDHGWVAHFVNQTKSGLPINIYGDGNQVRDILHIDDLVKAYEVAFNNLDKTQGQIFDIGGGPDNAVSLLELLKLLPKTWVNFLEARYGDQKHYVSDISEFKKLGWKPLIGKKEGIERLLNGAT